MDCTPHSRPRSTSFSLSDPYPVCRTPRRLQSHRQSQRQNRLVICQYYPATPRSATFVGLPPPRLLPASSPKASLLATLLKSSISESMFPSLLLLLRGVAGKAAASGLWNVLLAFLAGSCSATSVEGTTAGVCSAGSSCLRFGARRGGVVGVLRPPPAMTKAEGGSARVERGDSCRGT